MSASAGKARGVRGMAARAASQLPFLVDVYRFLRHPGWERAIRRDLRETRQAAAFLREIDVGPRAPALVVLYRDDLYETKLALTLAGALRVRGVPVVVSIPSGRAHRVRRYATAYGIERVIAQDTISLTEQERAECADVSASLLAGDVEFDAVKAWRFRGYELGNHVLSTLIRTTYDGSPDLSVDDNKVALRRILDDVLVNYIRAERLMTDLAPRVVLVEEANYSTNGPIVDVAVRAGVDVVQTVGTWRDDALISKRLTAATRRVEPKSVDASTLARLECEPWTPENDAELDADFAGRYGGAWVLSGQFQPGTKSRSRDDIVRELGLDPELPTAVIFAHVLWDASLFYGVDLFANYTDWLVQSVRAAIANPEVNWIVKTHPANVFRAAHGDVTESTEVTLIRRHFRELPDHVRVLLPDTRISTKSLYEFADYGVTVRGTPGMEMACFGKTVFTAGTGAYSGLGFTEDSDSVDEYLERLSGIQGVGAPPPAAVQRARRYVHALFVLRPWTTRSFRFAFDFAENGWHPLDRNVVLTAATVDEWRANGDLEDWTTWVLDEDDVDYVVSFELVG